MEEKKIKDLIKPVGNKVLIELIQESNEHIKGIQRLNPEVEVYVKVIAVGEIQKTIKPGDYALTRPGMTYNTFKVYGKQFSIIYDTDVVAVLDPAVLPELSTDKIKEVSPKLNLDIN